MREQLEQFPWLFGQLPVDSAPLDGGEEKKGE